MAISVTAIPARGDAGWFYVWLASALVLVTFGTFASSYFIPLAIGRFDGGPILHLHGVLFFAWPVLFLVQSLLAATGQQRRHRAFGLIGIALATAMVFSGGAALSSALNLWIARGVGEQGRAISIVALSGVVLFGVFVVAAIANVRRTDYHQRLMFLATLSIMQAGVGRFVLLLTTAGTIPFARPGILTPPPPELLIAPNLLFDALFLGAVLTHDWRTRGRPHPVYLLGGGCLVLVHALRHLVVDTAAWRALTDLLVAFGR